MNARASRGERDRLREHIDNCIEELGVGRVRLMSLAQSLICIRKHNRHRGHYSLSSARLQDELGKRYHEIVDPILPPVVDYIKGLSTYGRSFAWNRKRVVEAIRRAADIRGWVEVVTLVDIAFLNHQLSPPFHSYIRTSQSPDLPLFVALRLTRGMSPEGRAAIFAIIRQGGESYRYDPKGGRRYAKGSGLQRVDKKTRREALQGSGLVDIDMRRSFVTLLLWVLGQYNIPADTFTGLVQFSESHDLSSSDKEDCNAAMNGRRRPRTGLGLRIKNEMTVVRGLLGELGVNVAGRDWLHRLLAPLEDRVLQGILDGLRFLSLRPLSLIFDGLICEDPGREGLGILEGHLEARFPGLGMRLAVKERY